jgi:hypothetical protein
MGVVMADLEWADDVGFICVPAGIHPPKTDFRIRFLSISRIITQTMTIGPGDSSAIPTSTDPRLCKIHWHADELDGDPRTN